jgi:hypothetical protein
MRLHNEVTPNLPTPKQPQTPLKPANGFVGHVLDNKYTLYTLVKEDLTQQERLYLVSCAVTTTDTAIYAKEFSLTNISPKLYQSRRRKVRNFANKRKVLGCVDYCGKKFIIFDLTPKESPARKGKGKALDPELDDDNDETANGDQEGHLEGLKNQISALSTATTVKLPNEAASRPLDDTPGDGNNPKPQKHRRPRPRRGRRRALPLGAAGAGGDARLPSKDEQGRGCMGEISNSGEWAISDDLDGSVDIYISIYIQ